MVLGSIPAIVEQILGIHQLSVERLDLPLNKIL